MFEGMNFRERKDEIDQNFIGHNDVNMDIDINMAGMPNSMATPIAAQAPIMEAMQERVVHRTINHEVPHVCPMRTRVINHHVFRHTYRPCHSCCEENTISNVQCGSCCSFR